MSSSVERLSRHLPGIVRRNFRLKALAVILALTAWGVVVYASNPPDTRSFSVPVPQGNLPSKYILDPRPSVISVRMRGTSEHLDQFSTADLSVSVAFDKVHSTGQQDVAVVIANNDPDVELDSAPASISVDVDQLVSVSLPVSVEIGKDSQGKSLDPQPGYQIGDVTATPPEVTVTASQHRLQSIQGLKAVALVDLSAAKTTYVATEEVVLRDAQGNRITDLEVVVNSVQVRVVISSNIVTRASAVVPTLVGTAGPTRVFSGLVVNPQPFVILTGPQDVLNTLDAVGTDPVRLAGLGNGESVRVGVVVPKGVTADPASVDVVVSFLTIATPTPSPVATPTASPTSTPTARPPTPTPTAPPPSPT
ncbi:MAG TPA: CdaR family protein [Candidatus Dormibacteraeota bacterium]|nr:CdaR family protein [Candidatus Dormibacteraeota bacterium]